MGGVRGNIIGREEYSFKVRGPLGRCLDKHFQRSNSSVDAANGLAIWAPYGDSTGGEEDNSSPFFHNVNDVKGKY